MAMRAGALAWLLTALLLGLLSDGVDHPLLAEGEVEPRPGAANAEVRPEAGVASTLDLTALPTIDAPSPTCYRPEEHTDVCYVDWAYVSAYTVSPYYLISMTVSIDDRERLYTGGFFQAGAYLPAAMVAPGFKVACGVPGASGIPALGATHSFVIRVRDTTGAHSTASGSFICPADVIPVRGVNLDGPAFGATGVTQHFTATAEPVSATLPITYSFHGTDLTALTLNDGLTQVAGLTWDITGTKAVTVSAVNGAGGASAHVAIEIQDPVVGLTANNNGPANLGDSTRLVAQISGGSDVAFSWTYGDGRKGTGRMVDLVYKNAGRYTATVTASNGVSSQSASTEVIVRAPQPTTFRTFLPYVGRRVVR